MGILRIENFQNKLCGPPTVRMWYICSPIKKKKKVNKATTGKKRADEDTIEDAVERVAIILWTHPLGSQKIIRECYEGKMKGIGILERHLGISDLTSI